MSVVQVEIQKSDFRLTVMGSDQLFRRPRSTNNFGRRDHKVRMVRMGTARKDRRAGRVHKAGTLDRLSVPLARIPGQEALAELPKFAC